MDAKAIGEQIKLNRKLMGLTQEELANKASISVMSVRRYESGERIAPMPILQRFSDILEVPVSALLDEGQNATMVEIVEPDIDELRDEIRDLRYSLGRTGLVKTRDYMRDLMYNPENRPEPQKPEE